MKQTIAAMSIALFLAGISPGIYAASYYSDPAGGSMTNDGSEGSPWGNLEAIFQVKKTFSAGDEIFLLNGAHGQPYITGVHTDYVTIKPYSGHTPKIASVQLENGSYWAFDGVTFTSDGSGGSFTRDYMISTKDNATYLKIENCGFYSAENSDVWSKVDWYANAESAVIIRGDYTVFNTNTILNTYFALQIEGDYVEVRNNLIDNFGADAIRALGSHAVYENNVIRDAYIDDYALNHDDGIQLYDKDNVAGGVVDDVVIRNNTIYTFADPITQAMIDDNLVGYQMQGILTSDGHAENMVVENNLIVVDHYHGIYLAGAVNCRIQNNTVMKTPSPINSDTNAIPWIQLDEDKQHNQPANCIIRNNIASQFTPWSHAGGINIVVENNLAPEADEFVTVFSDYTNFIFALGAGSPAIDAGANTDLSVTDIEGNPRLVGPAVDQGAYEVQPSMDTAPPEISEIKDTYFNDEVVVTFNESVTESSAENLDNYSLTGGINILQASLGSDNSTVTLNTSPLAGGVLYTVAADGIEDYAGNPTTNVTADFKYLCNTNWASTYQDDQWGTNPPEDAFDGNLASKWAAEGTEWIQHSFCQARTLEAIDIAFPWGDQRSYYIMIEVSSDGRAFTPVLSGTSSGTTTALERFDFPDVAAKYVRVTGSGNTVNDWNNYSEIVIHTSEIPLSGYEAWLAGYPGVGSATNMTDNPDNDSLNNLYEWGLGGNPTNGNDIGYVPTLGIVEYLGDGWLEYTYAKRNDADALGLVYYVEQNTNLVDGVWTNASYDFQAGEPNSAGSGFGTVTNWVNTTVEDAQFLRLIIQSN